MSYSVIEDLLPLGTNRPGTIIHPIGVVIHETATPNATAQNEVNYFKGGNRNASAHYFVDDTTIIRDIPEDEMAWHAGPTANRRYLSIEICHFDDPTKFANAWARAVWLTADMCKRYGWTPDANSTVVSHAWVSATFKETDHTDPVQYFSAHGKTFSDFVNAVKALLSPPAPTPAPTPKPTPAPALSDDLPFLKQGSNSLAVRALQKLLNLNGACLVVDGDFGPATLSAVKTFQAKKGWTPNGEVGQTTWEA